VLVAAQGDGALADNLTEVAISALAERRDRDLVGMRELRGRLSEILPDGDIEACLGRADCLAALGVAAGAERAVIATVHRAGDQLTLDLSLTDTRTARPDARFSRTIPWDMGQLIATLRTGLAELFNPTPSPVAAATPPAIRLASAAGDSGAPPVHLDLARRAETGASGRGTGSRAAYAYAGFTAAALAVIAFSGAVVRGGMADATLIGSTRAEMQADLQQRKGYATTADELLVAGGALTVAAAAALVWWSRADGGHPR
jgi:hypothetical protein